jgi:serine/threonine-protein kinase
VSSTKPDPLIGSVIENRFVIHSLVGRGGMADVYMAKHLQVELTVAVKILQRFLVREETNIERFKREAQMVNSLFHPNIIKMYSFGILETGQPYLVFEYIEGVSLQASIESMGRAPLETARKLFVQICNGVAHAHEQGVLHRDLKPSNVMIISNDGDDDTVKILDFGIAKQLSHDGREAQRLTAANEIFGSPLYMSPEQCRGDTVDERSDIYSMGCLMYETLCGQPPFFAENPFVTMSMHVNEEPPPFEKFGVEVPIRLQQIIFKSLEKKREDRYSSMADIARELELVTG